MAETPASFDVEAFVLMHGAVHPSKLVEPSEETTPGCYQYQLTGKPLPENTQLCAPKILGKSYHAANISDFINTLRAKWDIHPLPDLSFSEFCLSELKTFEQRQVGLMEQEMEASDLMQIMEGGYTKERMKSRLILEGAIVRKSEIKWGQHVFSIAEKSYHVITKDSFENCIMFFCKGIEPPNPKPQRMRVNTSNGQITTVWVSYTKNTKLFKITFDRRNHIFSFEDLNNIIRSVVSGFTGDLDFNLTLFDFSCCVALFQDDECLIGLTPQLLSSTMLSNSGDGRPKLIYGTIREDRQQELELLQLQRLGTGHCDGVTSPSPPPPLSPFPSHSPYSYPSHSPSPAHPTSSLVVNLLGVDSFADFEPISRFESRRRHVRSTSIPPRQPVPEEVDGGGRPRVLKKVSRKRITRRRSGHGKFHAKGSIRRTRRQGVKRK